VRGYCSGEDQRFGTGGGEVVALSEGISEKLLSRKRFLQLGAAGIVGLTVGGINTRRVAAVTLDGKYVVQMEPNNKDAAERNRQRLASAIQNNPEVYIPPVEAGGYYIAFYDSPIYVPSDRGIYGDGTGKSRLLSPYSKDELTHKKTMFVNANGWGSLAGGNSNIVFDGIAIDGGLGETELVNLERGMVNTAIYIGAGRSGNYYCDNVRIQNCSVVNWPGVGLEACNWSRSRVEQNTLRALHRGGLVFKLKCVDVQVLYNTVGQVEDDAIAFNGTYKDDPDGTVANKEGTDGASEFITIAHNNVSRRAARNYTRDKDLAGDGLTPYIYDGKYGSLRDDFLEEVGGHGAVISIRAADGTTSTDGHGVKIHNNTIRYGNVEGMLLTPWANDPSPDVAGYKVYPCQGLHVVNNHFYYQEHQAIVDADEPKANNEGVVKVRDSVIESNHAHAFAPDGVFPQGRPAENLIVRDNQYFQALE
jgi:hypothetical protein